MSKINACIHIISSRTKCLEACLTTLYEYYNKKYNYSVYIHHFDNIYSKEYIDHIHKTISKNIKFIEIPYGRPRHIEEKDMYYNRFDIQYVRNGFRKENRAGFLHMCNFVVNSINYPKTELHKYDISLQVDDESTWLREPVFDPIEKIWNSDHDAGALKIVDQTKKEPHQGNFDTRVGLLEFIIDYIDGNNIKPKSEWAQQLIELWEKTGINSNKTNRHFHSYPIADSYVIKHKVFYSNEWKHFVKFVNEHGGIFKWRYGDNDLFSIFYLIYYEDFMYDLGLVDDGTHKQDGTKFMSLVAPSIKHPDRLWNDKWGKY